MRILLMARGSEDARSPMWAHVILPLRSLGHEVIALDAVQHEKLGNPDTQQKLQEFFLTQRAPDVVVQVPSDPKWDALMVELAATHNVRLQVLSVADLSLAVGDASLPPIVNTDLFRPVAPSQRSDVLVAGDGDDIRADVVRSLLDAGFDVTVFGSGWEPYADLDGCAYGARPVSQQAAVLCGAQVVVALDRAPRSPDQIVATGPTLVALEAMASGCAVVMPASVATNPLCGDMPTYTTNDDVVRAVTNAKQNVSALRETALARRDELVDHHSASRVLGRYFPADDTADPVVHVTKDGPRVSIFTATYNIEEFIGSSIESLLNQTMGDFEILLCNDGSRDNSRAIIGKYESDPRVRVFDQDNIGQTGRFDLIWRGLEPHARGEFYANLGGDDMARPDRFERQLAAMDADPKVGFVHTAGEGMGPHGEKLHPLFQLAYSYNDITQLRDLMFRCYVAHPSILMRRSVHDVVGTFEEGFPTDYHLWMKSAKHTRFRYLPEILIDYRIHEKGASSVGAGRERGELEGARSRAAERHRWSMLDLYPSLMDAPESDAARAYAAAHVDLGVRFLRGLYDADAALAEFERALILMGGALPEAEWNIAVTLLQDGRNAEAQQRLTSFDARNPTARQRFAPGGNARFAEGSEISNVPFGIPSNVDPAGVVCWDGTPQNTQRVLVIPSWTRTEQLTVCLEEWSRHTTPNMPLDLCIPSMGLDETDAADMVMRSLSPATDPSNAASITIERVDDISFLAQHRYSAILDLRQASVGNEAVRAQVASIAAPFRILAAAGSAR